LETPHDGSRPEKKRTKEKYMLKFVLGKKGGKTGKLSALQGWKRA